MRRRFDFLLIGIGAVALFVICFALIRNRQVGHYRHVVAENRDEIEGLRETVYSKEKVRKALEGRKEGLEIQIDILQSNLADLTNRFALERAKLTGEIGALKKVLRYDEEQVRRARQMGLALSENLDKVNEAQENAVKDLIKIGKMVENISDKARSVETVIDDFNQRASRNPRFNALAKDVGMDKFYGRDSELMDLVRELAGVQRLDWLRGDAGRDLFGFSLKRTADSLERLNAVLKEIERSFSRQQTGVGEGK